MDVEKFIGAVYIRTALWDKKDINHHNRYILDKLWKEVGREFMVSRDCARGRWKALRDKFRSTLAKINQRQLSGEGDPNDCIISWPYYRSLLFLREQFSDRKAVNHSTYNDSLQDPDDIDKSSDNYHDTSLSGFGEQPGKFSPASTDFLSPRNIVVPSPAPQEEKATEKKAQIELGKRPRSNEDIVKDLMQVEHKKLKYLKSLRNNIETADEDMSFFKSIIPHLKNLNSMDKMSFRIQVLRCVQEVIGKKNGTNPQPSSDSQSIPQISGEPYIITVSSASQKN